MKKSSNALRILLSLVLTIVICSCGTKSEQSVKEFWEINEDFVAPSGWQTKEYAHAFSIELPSYMVENGPYDMEHNLNGDFVESGKWKEVSFNSNKSDKAHDSYSCVNIKYLKGIDGDFNGYLEYLNISDPTVENFCNQLIKYQIGTGKLIKVLDKRMLYLKDFTALDMCYQRRGNTEGAGPVTVHIFFIQNYDEAVQITVAYHDKNKYAYLDLYNIINTFEWKTKNLRYTNRNL